MSLPALPKQISRDGHEVWDWACAASERLHREIKAKELSRQIRTVSCGDCDKWMKGNQCPMEKNVNGWNKGPSMNSPVCGDFVESKQSTAFRAQWRAELAALLYEVNPKPASDGHLTPNPCAGSDATILK